MPKITPKIPPGLEELMLNLAKSIIKENPQNLYEFSAEYFEKLLYERDGKQGNNYKKLPTYNAFKKHNSVAKTESDVSTKYHQQRKKQLNPTITNFLQEKIEINGTKAPMVSGPRKSAKDRGKGKTIASPKVPRSSATTKKSASIQPLPKPQSPAAFMPEIANNGLVEAIQVSGIEPENDHEMHESNTMNRETFDENNEKTTDSDEKLEISATKIQSSYRGYKVRKGLKSEAKLEIPVENVEKSEEQSENIEEKVLETAGNAEQNDEKSEIPAEKSEEQPENIEETSSKVLETAGNADQNDKKLEISATKIQSSYRGYKVRKGLKSDSKVISSTEMTQASENEQENIDGNTEENNQVKNMHIIEAEVHETLNGELDDNSNKILESSDVLGSDLNNSEQQTVTDEVFPIDSDDKEKPFKITSINESNQGSLEYLEKIDEIPEENESEVETVKSPKHDLNINAEFGDELFEKIKENDKQRKLKLRNQFSAKYVENSDQVLKQSEPEDEQSAERFGREINEYLFTAMKNTNPEIDPSAFNYYDIKSNENESSVPNTETIKNTENNESADDTTKEITKPEEKLELSATKIQSSYRGYKVRKQMKKELKPIESTDNAQITETEPEFVEKIRADPLENENLNSDEKLEFSATKIQSSYRGYKTRKELKRQPNLLEIGPVKLASNAKVNENAENPETEENETRGVGTDGNETEIIEKSTKDEELSTNESKSADNFDENSGTNDDSEESKTFGIALKQKVHENDVITKIVSTLALPEKIQESDESGERLGREINDYLITTIKSKDPDFDESSVFNYYDLKKSEMEQLSQAQNGNENLNTENSSLSNQEINAAATLEESSEINLKDLTKTKESANENLEENKAESLMSNTKDAKHENEDESKENDGADKAISSETTTKVEDDIDPNSFGYILKQKVLKNDEITSQEIEDDEENKSSEQFGREINNYLLTAIKNTDPDFDDTSAFNYYDLKSSEVENLGTENSASELELKTDNSEVIEDSAVQEEAQSKVSSLNEEAGSEAPKGLVDESSKLSDGLFTAAVDSNQDINSKDPSTSNLEDSHLEDVSEKPDETQTRDESNKEMEPKPLANDEHEDVSNPHDFGSLLKQKIEQNDDITEKVVDANDENISESAERLGREMNDYLLTAIKNTDPDFDETTAFNYYDLKTSEKEELESSEASKLDDALKLKENSESKTAEQGDDSAQQAENSDDQKTLELSEDVLKSNEDELVSQSHEQGAQNESEQSLKLAETTESVEPTGKSGSTRSKRSIDTELEINENLDASKLLIDDNSGTKNDDNELQSTKHEELDTKDIDPQDFGAILKLKIEENETVNGNSESTDIEKEEATESASEFGKEINEYLLEAMKKSGLDSEVEKLESYLKTYNQAEGIKKDEGTDESEESKTIDVENTSDSVEKGVKDITDEVVGSNTEQIDHKKEEPVENPSKPIDSVVLNDAASLIESLNVDEDVKKSRKIFDEYLSIYDGELENFEFFYNNADGSMKKSPKIMNKLNEIGSNENDAEKSETSENDLLPDKSNIEYEKLINSEDSEEVLSTEVSEHQESSKANVDRKMSIDSKQNTVEEELCFEKTISPCGCANENDIHHENCELNLKTKNSNQESENNIQENENSKKQEQSAIKIQSVYRGYKVRKPKNLDKQLKDIDNQSGSDALEAINTVDVNEKIDESEEEQRVNTVISENDKEADSNQHEDEKNDNEHSNIDINKSSFTINDKVDGANEKSIENSSNPEKLEFSATKIQSSYRGYKTRKELKRQPNLLEIGPVKLASNAKVNENAENPETEENETREVGTDGNETEIIEKSTKDEELSTNESKSADNSDENSGTNDDLEESKTFGIALKQKVRENDVITKIVTTLALPEKIQESDESGERLGRETNDYLITTIKSKDPDFDESSVFNYYDLKKSEMEQLSQAQSGNENSNTENSSSSNQEINAAATLEESSEINLKDLTETKESANENLEENKAESLMSNTKDAKHEKDESKENDEVEGPDKAVSSETTTKVEDDIDPNSFGYILKQKVLQNDEITAQEIGAIEDDEENKSSEQFGREINNYLLTAIKNTDPDFDDTSAFNYYDLKPSEVENLGTENSALELELKTDNLETKNNSAKDQEETNEVNSEALENLKADASSSDHFDHKISNNLNENSEINEGIDEVDLIQKSLSNLEQKSGNAGELQEIVGSEENNTESPVKVPPNSPSAALENISEVLTPNILDENLEKRQSLIDDFIRSIDGSNIIDSTIIAYSENSQEELKFHPKSDAETGEEEIASKGTKKDAEINFQIGKKMSTLNAAGGDNMEVFSEDSLEADQKSENLHLKEEEKKLQPKIIPVAKIQPQTYKVPTEKAKQSRSIQSSSRSQANYAKLSMLRQKTMPVQIESDVMRILPKHLRKRIKSAEGEKKRKPKQTMK